MYPLTVVRQQVVQASWDECWRCLTTPAIVSEWFAATEAIRAGEPVVFDFGDGDFFAGRVVDLEPPSRLRLTWRFWDTGPSYDIAYVLAPLGEAVEVSVIDRGSGSVDEVDSLREGWADFLGRLKTRAETGTPCRYRWSETLGGTCFARDTPELRARLDNPRWWDACFPDARISLRVEQRGWRLQFQEPSWHDVVTDAHVRFASYLGRPCLRVAHDGWPTLPYDTQVDIRRHYAGLWRAVLASIEAEFGASRETPDVVDAAS